MVICTYNILVLCPNIKFHEYLLIKKNIIIKRELFMNNYYTLTLNITLIFVNRTPRLKNVDRSTAHSMEVTVNNVTVIITDFQLKKEKNTSNTPLHSPSGSSPNKANSGHTGHNSDNVNSSSQAGDNNPVDSNCNLPVKSDDSSNADTAPDKMR